MPIDQNIVLYIYSLITILVLVLFWRNERKLNKLLLGKNGKTLEDSIFYLKDILDKLMQFKKDTENKHRDFDERIQRSVQGVETIKFNPFKGTGSGGNQSFSTAIINEKGDGVVISSLYSRERVSIFSKPIKTFTSEQEMTEEEKEVLEKAKINIRKK